MVPLLSRFFPSRRSSESPGLHPRVIVFPGPGLENLICSFPLLHALRRHYPQSHLSIASEMTEAPMAQACTAAQEVVVIEPGRNSWHTAWKNSKRLQGYDWAIAATPGVDRRTARLVRLTRAKVRVGFERSADSSSEFFTEPVALPTEPGDEHKIETMLRLLKPLGLVKPTGYTINLEVALPAEAHDYRANWLARPPFLGTPSYALVNFSSLAPIKFREQDFIALISRLLASTDLTVAFLSSPAQEQTVHEIATCMASNRLIALAPPGPLEHAAMIEKAFLLITPEGDTAHIAATLNTPTVVLWSNGDYPRTRPRGGRHHFVHPQAGEKNIPVERVWQALQPLIVLKH